MTFFEKDSDEQSGHDDDERMRNDEDYEEEIGTDEIYNCDDLEDEEGHGPVDEDDDDFDL